VPLALKANRLIALAAVKQSARIFKSLPEDVKADREARKHGMEDG
jgi:CII-binding regulator of phage lambda lysogenization HflD